MFVGCAALSARLFAAGVSIVTMCSELQIDESRRLIDVALNGLAYYHNYDRSLLGYDVTLSDYDSVRFMSSSRI